MGAGDLPLHIETSGRAAGPEVDSVVLLHGYGASSYSWRHWVPRLGERAHVVAVDLKGFGAAPRVADGRYAIADQADLVRRMVLERDLRRVFLFGHSLGGAIALRLALHFEDDGDERLRRMVIVGGAAYPQRMPPFVHLANHRRLGSILWRVLGARFIVRHVMRSIVYDPSCVTEEDVRAYAAPLARTGSLDALIDSALQLVPPDVHDVVARFPEITVPTLLIWGSHDRVVPLWVGERLKAELSDATLHVFDRCGHLPAEERPWETLERVEAFLWGMDRSA